MNADRQRRAQLRGLGVATAMGRGLAANVEALAAGASRTNTLTLREFREPLLASCLLLDDAVERAAFFAPVGDVVEQALADAGVADHERRTLPLFIGSSSYAIGASERDFARELRSDSLEGLPVPSAGFSQVSRYLAAEHGLGGVDFLFNTACTASANALMMAADAIAAGRCEQALVIGFELFNLTTVSGFAGMQLLTDGVMRPFDRRRNGLVVGEGCAALLLAPADTAAPGGDGIVIAGGASSCDTFSVSTSNPDGSAIAEVMAEALENAGIGATAVAAIKAHGTASPLNDDAEAAGVLRVFSEPPALFALKSCFGHTLGGCGAIETALVAGALQQGFIPASAGFEAHDDELGVRLLTHRETAGPGYYLLNYFGFGGNNASVVLEKRG